MLAGFFLLPLIAFFTTRCACLGLQRRDRRALARVGVETGLITKSPHGDFAPAARPISEEELAVLETRRPQELIAPIPRHIISRKS